MHGGEAHASRDAFAKLSDRTWADVVLFLKTLQVLPQKVPRVLVTAPSTQSVLIFCCRDTCALAVGHRPPPVEEACLHLAGEVYFSASQTSSRRRFSQWLGCGV
jgi:hypothetical protein